jgi:hypothetical protein
MIKENQEEVINFISKCKKRYENRLGSKLNLKSRLRVNVEQRVAFTVAVRPYATLVNIAKVLGKDHSTLVHSIKSHDVHVSYSPSYRSFYDLALQSVHEQSVESKVMPFTTPDFIYDMVREIESLESILSVNKRRLNKFLDIQSKKSWRFSPEERNEILSLQQTD